MISNENIFMLYCVCVHRWVQSKATHDHDVDQMWRPCGAQMQYQSEFWN